MNVTLSLDDDLVKKARKIAIDSDTTLTDMIREYLERVAAEDAASGRKLREREILEQSLKQFQFRVGKRTSDRATCRRSAVKVWHPIL
jgi:hypothetical protein